MTVTILVLNKLPPFRESGAEKVVWNLGVHLADQGWDVHYLSPLTDDPNVPEVENISFHDVPISAPYLSQSVSYFLTGLPEYVRLVRDLKPDIVYDNASPFPFVWAHLFDPERTVTKVHEVEGFDALKTKATLVTKLGTFVGDQFYRLKDGRRMITVSESTRKDLTDRVLKNPDRVVAVPNGIDPTAFTYRYEPTGDVLCLCELTPRKGVDTLLRAWQLLEDEGVDRTLVIAGDGPSRNGLERTARELGLESVDFRGYVTESEKRRLFEETYCYVLPTLYEGLGLSNLEAMASGCVVISTDAPGVRDYLVDRTNGLVVPRENPKRVADAIRYALSHPDECERLTVNARETVEDEFSLDDSLERERELLEAWRDDASFTRENGGGCASTTDSRNQSETPDSASEQ